MDISIRRFFGSKMLKNTKLEMRKETKKKEKKQFEPDGTWNKKNMCSKNKKTRGKRETQSEREKRKRGDEQMKKCKEEDKKPEEISKNIFPSKKGEEEKKEKSK